ncbi:MAG: DUF559 domain-containing protein [Flavobacterium sp.]|nr:DUF559 domain-containing protein [Flavobacterium sp.]
MERDLKNNVDLQDIGYTIIRFWEHEIRKDLDNCISKIIDLVSCHIF